MECALAQCAQPSWLAVEAAVVGEEEGVILRIEACLRGPLQGGSLLPREFVARAARRDDVDNERGLKERSVERLNRSFEREHLRRGRRRE